MVELIKSKWSSSLPPENKSYSVLCKFEPQFSIGKTATTQCYSIVFFGAETPVSHCCGQLVCFLFISHSKRLEVKCLRCRHKKNLIDSIDLDDYFVFACFETTNHVGSESHSHLDKSNRHTCK